MAAGDLGTKAELNMPKPCWLCSSSAHPPLQYTYPAPYTIHILLSALYIPVPYTIHNFSLHYIYSALYTIHTLFSTLYIPHSLYYTYPALYTIHSLLATLYIPHSFSFGFPSIPFSSQNLGMTAYKGQLSPRVYLADHSPSVLHTWSPEQINPILSLSTFLPSSLHPSLQAL